MIDLDKLIGRVVQLEKELNELKESYQKDVNEAYRAGYRDGYESQEDSYRGNEGLGH
jgi:flagellar biosynthesis/type III secretory pathway protein FliH